VELGTPPVYLAVSKDPATQTVVTGGTASFTITAQNTGVEDIENVVIDDPLCDTLTGPTGDDGDGVLETTETWSWICTVNNVTADFTNTATVSGTAATSGSAVSEQDTADVTVVNAGISVSKDPATQTVVSGGSASFTITVDNTGDVDLSNVVVDDPLCDVLTGPSGDTDSDSVLDVDETWSYDCTVNNVTSDFTNTATVTGTPPTGGDVSDTDTADVVVVTSAVSAVKSSQLVGDNDGSGGLSPGDDLLYTIVISNEGTADALDVLFLDTPDPNTTLRTGTVTTTQGTVVTGNVQGDTDVAVDVGTLVVDGEVTVAFEVRINDPFPTNVDEVVNQGIVTGSNISDVFTDDPNTNPSGDPTSDPVEGPDPAEIPTLSEWGLILFIAILLGGALGILRKRGGVVPAS
jgi:uncharacterized repeat protein (TIGR01451 family)